MKALILGICLILLPAMTVIDAAARPPCEKVWVEGHYNKHGKWIEPHWRHKHWVPGHHNSLGEWVPGHCR